MTDYLTRLLDGARGRTGMVRPRLAALFEPSAPRLDAPDQSDESPIEVEDEVVVRGAVTARPRTPPLHSGPTLGRQRPAPAPAPAPGQVVGGPGRAAVVLPPTTTAARPGPLADMEWGAAFAPPHADQGQHQEAAPARPARSAPAVAPPTEAPATLAQAREAAPERHEHHAARSASPAPALSPTEPAPSRSEGALGPLAPAEPARRADPFPLTDPQANGDHSPARQPTTTIVVSIGRIEVRAPAAPPSAQPPRPRQPAARRGPSVSLVAYLARRNGAGR
jgi:hypothetical protein